MFEATYLGNQGWLFAAGETSIIVDPIFGSEFGRGPEGARYRCHPPREWNVEALPPIDAMIITHEHEDHLNIPSLARVDRRVPVFLSRRASHAAHAIVRELGFDVAPLEPGGRLTFGELELRTFTPDHVTFDEIDEWDTLGFAVEARGDGAFFTNVDVHVTSEMALHVRRSRQERRATSTDAGATLVFYAGAVAEVEAVAVDAEPRGRLRHELDPERALECLASQGTFWPAPGLSFRMERGRTVRVTQAPYVRSPSVATWPPPSELGGATPDGELLPACGRPTFDEAHLPRLSSVLRALASFLYGRMLFRRLLSLSTHVLDGRRPTFVVLLRTDLEGGSYAVEYDPSGSSFRFLDGDGLRLEDYVGGVELWANDLLALADGTFEPRIVSSGHLRQWSASAKLLAFDFEREALWPYFHPLNHQDACLRRYREVARAMEGTAIQVHRRG